MLHAAVGIVQAVVVGVQEPSGPSDVEVSGPAGERATVSTTAYAHPAGGLLLWCSQRTATPGIETGGLGAWSFPNLRAGTTVPRPVCTRQELARPATRLAMSATAAFRRPRPRRDFDDARDEFAEFDERRDSFRLSAPGCWPTAIWNGCWSAWMWCSPK